METDSALWEHLRNEETRLRAFEVLVERHYTQMKGWIRRWVHDEALTEDLTQKLSYGRGKNATLSEEKPSFHHGFIRLLAGRLFAPCISAPSGDGCRGYGRG